LPISSSENERERRNDDSFEVLHVRDRHERGFHRSGDIDENETDETKGGCAHREMAIEYAICAIEKREELYAKQLEAKRSFIAANANEGLQDSHRSSTTKTLMMRINTPANL